MKNIVEKAKSILLSPRSEWEKIGNTPESHIKVLTGYLVWLALIPAVAAFIGWGLIGYKVYLVHVGSMSLGIRYAVMQFISVIGGAYLTAGALYFLAPNFGAEKNFDKAFQLSAYCYTAMCVGGIFYIYSPLSFLAALASLYSLYLLYIGIKPVMKTTDEKTTSYFVMALICMIVVSAIVSVILGKVFGLSFYNF